MMARRGHRSAATPSSHAHQRVEDDEREADEQANLGPAEAEVGDEQRRQARDELPVDEIEDVEGRHHAEQHPGGSGHGVG